MKPLLRTNPFLTFLVSACSAALPLACASAPVEAEKTTRSIAYEVIAEDLCEPEPEDLQFKCLSFLKYKKCSGYILTDENDPDDLMPIHVATDLYLPHSPQSVPLLVYQHGGGNNKNNMASRARNFARDGYAVAAFTARGLGKGKEGVCSTGTPAVVDPDKEGEDLIDVIRWVGTHASSEFGANVDTQRVGVLGPSYGGLQTWAAGAMKHQGDGYHILAIAPQATGVDLVHFTGARMSPRKVPVSNAVMNCCFQDGFKKNAAAGSPWIDEFYEALDTNDISLQDMLLHETKRRSVAWLGYNPAQPDLLPIHDPLPEDLKVLLIHPWHDGAFPVDPSIDFFQRIRVGHEPNERKLVLAGFGHPSPLSTCHLSDVSDPYIPEIQHKFFDCHLRNNRHGACDDPEFFTSPITYAFPGDTSVHVDVNQLPMADTEYFLSRDEVQQLALSDQAPTQDYEPAAIDNLYFLDEPGRTSAITAPIQDKVVFDTPELEVDTEWVGGAIAKLYVESQRYSPPHGGSVTHEPAEQHEYALSVRVYDVAGPNFEEQDEQLIARGVYWYQGPEEPGQIRPVSVRIGAMAYRFAQGHKIRIKITNVDRFDDNGTRPLWRGYWNECTLASNLSMNLWTLPSYVSSTQLIHLGGTHRSKINMPLRQLP